MLDEERDAAAGPGEPSPADAFCDEILRSQAADAARKAAAGPSVPAVTAEEFCDEILRSQAADAARKAAAGPSVPAVTAEEFCDAILQSQEADAARKEAAAPAAPAMDPFEVLCDALNRERAEAGARKAAEAVEAAAGAASEPAAGPAASAPPSPSAAAPGWGATASAASTPPAPAAGAPPASAAAAGPAGGTPSRSAQVSTPVAGLVSAVDLVLAQVPSQLPEAQALADTAVLLAQVERLRADLLGRIADVERRKLHLLDGAGSTPAWIEAQHTSLDRGEVALARRMGTLPTLDEAVRSGGLSIAVAERVGKALAKLRRHVDRPDGLIDGQDGEQALLGVIGHGVRQLVCQFWGGVAEDDPRLIVLLQTLADIVERPSSQLTRLEAAFVVLATHLEAQQLPGALGQLVDALLPNELEKRAQDGHDNRGFTLTPDQDGWRITEGDLDLECGEYLAAVLAAELTADPDNPVDTEAFTQLRAQGWQDGDPLPDPGTPGPRSLRQQRHDALKNALRRLLNSGELGLRDKAVPHINVVLGADQLTPPQPAGQQPNAQPDAQQPGAQQPGAQQPGAQQPDAQPGAAQGAPAGGPMPGGLPAVSLTTGARLPASLVRRWLCDSAITRFVLSLGGRVIETSHTERTLKAHERQIKKIETANRCQIAGCRCGPSPGRANQLVPHHPDGYAKCGSTSLGDTVWICLPHHHDLHIGKKTLRLRDGRWLNENGWTDGPGPRA